MDKLLMIFNPKSGKNSTREKHDTLIRKFKEHGFAITEKTTTCVGDATEIVKHNYKGHNLIVCCGGDGTFNEVINGIMAVKIDIPLIYYPMGSTNDLANTIGVSKDVDAQIELYRNGNINSYDIGQFNDRFFTYVASFGVGSDLSYNTSQKLKNVFGHTAYVINGFVFDLPNQIKNIKPHHMVIEHDGGVIEDDFYFGAISNTNEVGGVFKYDKRGIKLNDGIFEVLLVRKVKGFSDTMRLLRKVIKQDYNTDQLIIFNTSNIKIKSDDELAWTLDGEFGGNHKRIDIKNLNGAVNIVAPPSKYFITDKKAPQKKVSVFDEELAQAKK